MPFALAGSTRVSNDSKNSLVLSIGGETIAYAERGTRVDRSVQTDARVSCVLRSAPQAVPRGPARPSDAPARESRAAARRARAQRAAQQRRRTSPPAGRPS